MGEAGVGAMAGLGVSLTWRNSSLSSPISSRMLRHSAPR